MEKVTGYVTGVNGNLVSARFSGSVRKNEVGFVKIGNDRLKGEVIRISGDAVSMQIYEMTNGIQVGDEVELTGELLSVELGPGLLTQVYDGLQTPLPQHAEQSGFIADLGYEAYQKILEEAVDELKNDEFSDLYNELSDGKEKEGKDFVKETYIESDLEMLFPPTYIPNDSERISLYRELDNMELEEDIKAFSARLEDRFGKIPKEGKELIRIVRLRRMARSLGIEKVVLKKGQMNMYLVSADDSPYYQSHAFGQLLAYIQKHPRICNLKEVNGKRSIVIKDVPTAAMACSILEEMESL